MESGSVERHALELAGLAAAVVAAGAGWDPFLTRLAQTLGATAPGVMLVERASQKMLLEVHRDVDAAWDRAYNDYYWKRDIRRRALQSQPVGTVTAGDRIVRNGRLLRSEFYNDFLKPQGFFHIAFGLPVKDEAHAAMVRVVRPREALAFADEELSLLRLIVPHVRSAMLLSLEFRGERERSRSLAGALDALVLPAFVVRRDSEVIHKNEAGAALLDSGNRLVLGKGKLRAVKSDETRSLRQAIAGAASGSLAAREASLQISTAAGGSLGLRVLPLGAPDVRGECGRALVLVDILGRGFAVEPSLLSSLYGFSPRETQVAIRLLAGASVPTIARELGVSGETIRTFSTRLFAKVGVRRKAEFLALIASGPAGVAAVQRPRSR